MSLPINNGQLAKELRGVLSELDMQIMHIKNDIKLGYPEEQRDKINVWYWTRDSQGSYILQDLLVARANVLAAIANLQASGVKR